VTRREGIFAQPAGTDPWLAAVRDVKRRDGFAALVWHLMSNHFSLVLRTGPVPLWRSMRSMQGQFAMGKSAESATRWVTHASARRRSDPDFAALLERLDATLAWPALHQIAMQECQA
jgi:hypothetical protein